MNRKVTKEALDRLAGALGMDPRQVSLVDAAVLAADEIERRRAEAAALRLELYPPREPVPARVLTLPAPRPAGEWARQVFGGES